MEITDKLIDHISRLCMLSFEGDKKEMIRKDLENMLTFMEKLNEVDTDNVEPLIFMTEEINVLREDVPFQTITHEEALRNAPKKDSDYFRIPKVVDKTIE